MSTAASYNDKSDKEDQASRNKAVDGKESGDVLSKEKVMGEYELDDRKREVTKWEEGGIQVEMNFLIAH